jgi:phosphoribosylanthranilate isomerase
MSRRVFVKICGLTSPGDAIAAAEAGADAVGLVFWPGSRRYVTAEAARRIARALPPFVVRVGVFLDANRDDLDGITSDVGLDLLQLHGRESPESLSGLPRRVLKAVSVGDGFEPEEAWRFEGQAAGVLLDTRSDHAPGGTGQTFDWSIARRVRERASFLVLAGGLTAANVASAIAAVDPDGVDVSSGVESSPGRKDAARMREFIRAVRGAAR